MAGEVVLACYRPHPGKEFALLERLRRHVPLLRAEGLATDRPVTLLRSHRDGAIIEIFEWVSPDAARRAHESPKVLAMWESIGHLADARALVDLAEAGARFPHFGVLEGVVE